MPSKPDQAAQTMIDNLPEKTGKSLEEWIEVIRGTDLRKHKEIMTFLKNEHGVTHGYANTITLLAREQFEVDAGGQPAEEVDLVANQYSGDKASLKPIYDRLASEILAFGPDVEISPKKAYVSLRRNKQFGLIQPSTKTRVDVGINLPDSAPGERLEASGSFNTMVSHRVRLESPEQVDDELIGWLRSAYESC